MAAVSILTACKRSFVVLWFFCVFSNTCFRIMGIRSGLPCCLFILELEFRRFAAKSALFVAFGLIESQL